MTKKKVIFERLTDAQQDEFVQGFMDADETHIVKDWDSCDPWGCPWFWASYEYLGGGTPYEWGASWFELNRAEIEELTAQEKEA